MGFNVNVVNLQELSDEQSCREHLLWNNSNKGFQYHEQHSNSRPRYTRRDSGFVMSQRPIRAIFIISSYGEGSCPDSAARFIYWIKEQAGLLGKDSFRADEHSRNLLKRLEYSVFGLGDSRFGSSRHNAVAKMLDNALSVLGATRFVSLGLGDSSDDLEWDFEKWQWRLLWPALIEREPALTKKTRGHQKEELPFSVEWLSKEAIVKKLFDGRVIPDPVITDDIDVSTQHYFYAVACRVIEAANLKASHSSKPTLHIALDITCSSNLYDYQTGDHLHILPINEPHRVVQVAAALHLELDSVFRLKPSNKPGTNSFKHLFPTPCTVRDLLSNYCDLSSPPQRSKLKLLSRFATNRDDAAILKRLGSSQGQLDFKKLILERHVGMMDLLTLLFPSIKIPFDYFIAVCPRLQPRIYTISSSPSLHPREIHLTVACIQHRTIDGTLRQGVCSSYLQSFQNSKGLICRAFSSASCFRVPSDVSDLFGLAVVRFDSTINHVKPDVPLFVDLCNLALESPLHP